MDPKVVEIDSFKIAGITTRTTNGAEANPSQAKIPSLWRQFYAELIGDRVDRQPAGPEVYGVYWDYESDASGAYNVTVGAPVAEAYQADEELSELRIESGLYLAFHAVGASQETVPTLWGRVWKYFSRPRRHKRRYTTDFERYEGPEAVTIFIAVEASGD